jgi:hypothetical protein
VEQDHFDDILACCMMQVLVLEDAAHYNPSLVQPRMKAQFDELIRAVKSIHDA